MKRVWKLYGLEILLVSGILAAVVWANETIEIATYVPAPASSSPEFDRLHAKRATIGDAYKAATVPDSAVPDGSLFVSGNVGIGTSTPAPSLALDVTSTNKGFAPPRMTTTQRNNIASPATGSLIYNTTTNQYNYFNGSSWTILSGGGTGGTTVTSKLAADVNFVTGSNKTLVTVTLTTQGRPVQAIGKMVADGMDNNGTFELRLFRDGTQVDASRYKGNPTPVNCSNTLFVTETAALPAGSHTYSLVLVTVCSCRAKADLTKLIVSEF